jgi:hypothetical protein
MMGALHFLSEPDATNKKKLTQATKPEDRSRALAGIFDMIPYD